MSRNVKTFFFIQTDFVFFEDLQGLLSSFTAEKTFPEAMINVRLSELEGVVAGLKSTQKELSELDVAGLKGKRRMIYHRRAL